MRQRVSVPMIFTTLVALLLLGSLPYVSSAISAQLSDQLESTLSARTSGEFVSVLVFLQDQVDVESLQRNYKLATFTRQASHKILMEQLRDFAGASQASLTEVLDEAKSRGEVRSYQTYWITNALQIEATKSFIETLRNRPDIEAMIEDLPMQSLYYPPSNSTATSAQHIGVPSGLRLIHADSMWAQGLTGAGTLIASFDTGVNGLHPALRNSYHGNHGFPSSQCWFDPVYGETYPHNAPPADLPEGWQHGTATMGIMVGKNDATGDTLGVAFGADWISAAVIDIPGANYLEAFQWAADPDGDPNTVDDVPDVLNNSWGFKQSNISCLDIFWKAIDNLEALGTVVVFACGNEGPAPMSLRNPANRATTLYNSFAVGGVSATNEDSIYQRSSRGPSDCDSVSIKPQVMAPGYQVLVISADTLASYSLADGTSFAAPHVAGAVAILRQYNPNAPVDSIKSALMRSAVDKGAPGPDNNFGWGVIDLPAAKRLLAPNNQVYIYVKEASHAPISPGDVVSVTVTLRNSGAGTVGVTGVLSNPPAGVSILQGYSSFGTMPGNSSASNFGNPYSISFSNSIAEGTIITVDLIIHDGSSYERTIKLYFTVGTALVKSSYTQTTDSCRFTVSNYGTYGLAPGSILNKGGAGFTFPQGATNNLFQCGLMIATDSTHVSDGVVNLLGSPDEDFAVALEGNLTVSTSGGTLGDHETLSRFNDNNASRPLGLLVEQRTANYTDLADAQYAIMEFVITNTTASQINGVYAGLYCDWDFPWGSGGYDWSGFSRSYGLGYMYQNGPLLNSYRGTSVLNAEGVSTFYAIRNLGNVYTPPPSEGLVSEGTKFRFLTHGFEDTASSTPYDQSYCIATGPFNLAPGASDTVAFAMIGGANLSALQAAALSAKNHYRQATPVEDGGGVNLPSAYKLDQNRPNPFNPQTVISYSIPHTGQVNVSVFNVLGEKIATLVDQLEGAGEHSIVWNSTDDEGKPVASGIYFYRLKTDDFAQTRKMILLK